MEFTKVVARFKDGSIIKGMSSNFSPTETIFRIKPKTGDFLTVDINELKALFFVKSFRGDKDHIEEHHDIKPWDGNKIQVHFADGEIIFGYTLHYDFGHHGFFMTPADTNSNNKEIFVITSAAEKITFI